jgi:putative resolvase
VNLTEWAKAQGMHPQTAYRWFREGTLPVPAQRVGPRTIPVNIEASTAPEAMGGRACMPASPPTIRKMIRSGR